MNDIDSRKQIVDKVKDNSNILVIVNSSPSVDELSAALGLTLLVNKMNKHGTAIFSGDIPPAINFLDPEKTFENTVDSLRDFIIALDKEKADHLRYKVEGDMVKIFITPYRTTITDADLDFSQGDYNVELVLAINVKSEADLDKALAAHGKILHDATVASISLASDKSNLGGIAWIDGTASCYSEMIVALSDAMKDSKNLVDEQISTALLTGIVAATERFSNNKTSSRIMTMAAQLMAAGANQQLIATQLEEAEVITESASEKTSNSDGTTDLSEGQSTKVGKPVDEPAEPEAGIEADGALAISHEKQGDLETVSEETRKEDQQDAAEEASRLLANETDPDPEAELTKHLDATNPVLPPAIDEPSLGGTLNATTEKAAEDKKREIERDQNHTILSHGGTTYIDDQPTYQAPLNAVSDEAQAEPKVKDIFAEAPVEETTVPDLKLPALPPLPPLAPTPVLGPDPVPTPAPEPIPEPQPSAVPTLEEIDRQNRQQHDDARADVHAAFESTAESSPTPDFSVTPEPQTDLATLPPLPSIGPAPAPQPATPLQPGQLPPLPDFATLPPLPPLPGAPVAPTTTDNTSQPAAPAETQPFDPGQFQIPTK